MELSPPVHLVHSESLLRKAALRFFCIYAVLFFFPTPLGGVVHGTQWLTNGVAKAWQKLDALVGVGLLQLPPEVFGRPVAGSPDRIAGLVHLLSLTLVGLALTCTSFAIPARRVDERKWQATATLWVRYALAVTLLRYGLIKVFKTQFSTPDMGRLLQPYGESSPMGLLWTFMGASTPYTMFAGLLEVIPGLLLFFRRTAVLGALIGAATLTNVLMLNLCYDVPVKLFSAHLLVFCGLIAAPHAARIAAALLGQATEAAPEEWPPASRLWRALALAFALACTGSIAHQAWKGYRSWGDGQPQPAASGLWEVEEHRRDGQPLPLHDARRWRRLGLDARGFTVVKADGERIRLVVEDFTATELTVAGPIAGGETTLKLDSKDPEHPVLRGPWEGWHIELRLRRADSSRTLLRDRGFHFINETPFNR
jgi:hypothetical protein